MTLEQELPTQTPRVNLQRKLTRRSAVPPGKKSGLYVILFITIMSIAVFGIVMILSASSHTAFESTGTSWFWFKKHLLYFGLGVIALIVGLRVPYHFWGRLAKPLLLFSFFLMFLVLIPKLGVSVNGARRWINLGFITVQPAELAKLSLVIYLSFLMHSRRDRLGNSRLSIRPVMVIVSMFILLALIQPDLGSSIVLATIAFFILFGVGAPFRSLGLWASGAFASVFVLSAIPGYRRNRLLAFVDPWDDPLDTGYQTLQSLVAVASGGFWGRGLGAGRAKWGYLPFAHTDFIFAIVAEELGIVGASFLILAFLVLFVSGILVALRAQDLLGTALASGITGWVGIQFFLNIGAALGLLPITGLTLPLVSYGGSSFIITMMALGILLNVARFSRVPVSAKK